MNKNAFARNWKKQKCHITHKSGKLLDDDIPHAEETYEELTHLLEEKYDYEKEDAERAIASFLQRHYFNV